ncbi:peptide ABC transporter substrate-binding protein [Treponema denticola]|uniref:Peptide ABC transporter substrate-binding protein n=1 Tax=Treponema denticola TaxID=158 RepID=A0A9Q9BEI1_TREDN|nr:ABC transporter substrate-binding protein [Treponema denticola]UTC89285.1 peptide ABC transporter substrate-binding protein [Treponema denticola]UTD01359.1 peptide ABC transporter substrate-binding protein [Treponema denticola]
MKKRIAMLLTAAVLTVTVLVISCSKNEAEMGTGKKATEKTTIIVRAGGDPMSWNPDSLPDDNGYPIFQNIFNRLVKLDASKNIIPDLAESWDISPDGKEITFYLHTVEWHDGKPVTADDVKYTFDYIAKKNTYLLYSRLQIIDEIVVKDSKTVVFKLKYPDVSLVANLGWYASFVLPKHIFDNGQEWEDNIASKEMPIGSGPFKLLKFKQGESVTLEANKNYFMGAPKLDNVIFTMIPDNATAVQALVNGEIDVLENVPAANNRELLANPQLRLVFNEYPSPMRIIFNMRNEKVKDVHLRKAIASAINKKEISDKIFDGVQKPEYAMYPEFIKWVSNTENVSPQFNIDVARKILQDAGYKADKDGFFVRGLQIEVFEGGGYPDAAKLMQATLAKAGIELKVNVSEFNAWADKVGTNKDFIMELQGGFMGPDPAALYSRYGTGESNNWSGYSNIKFDELCKKGLTVGNKEERAAIYKEAQKILAEDLPFIPIVGFASYDANSVNFKNLPIDGTGKWGWQEYTFTEKVK